MKNIATGDVLERIRRLAPSHVTAPFKTVAEWREWQLSEGQKRCEEINRQNRQLRVEKILNRSGIQPLHRKCSFSNYQVQNEAQRYALSQAKSIADELMTGCTNFAFSGKPGTGKNHLAAAIGNRLLKDGQTVIVVTVADVMSALHASYDDGQSGEKFLRELCEHHVSGQLKVAPEHISNTVLQKLGKPSVEVYNSFVKAYKDMNKKIGKEQYLVPYLMSSHPGSTLKEAVELAEYLRDLGYMPEQVQDFYPTPSTISTCMYYTGLDPRTMEPVYVATNPHEKAMQRALIQYRNPKNYDLVHEALIKAGRQDLIGFDSKCLIRPRRPKKDAGTSYRSSRQGKKAPAGKAAAGKMVTAKHKKKTIRNIHKKK